MEILNAETLAKITEQNRYKRELMYNIEQRLKQEAEDGYSNTACSGRGLIELTNKQENILKQNGYTVDWHGDNKYVICW